MKERAILANGSESQRRQYSRYGLSVFSLDSANKKVNSNRVMTPSSQSNINILQNYKELVRDLKNEMARESSVENEYSSLRQNKPSETERLEPPPLTHLEQEALLLQQQMAMLRLND